MLQTIQLWEGKWGMAVNAEVGVKGTKAAWPVSLNTLLVPPYCFLYSKEFYFYFAFSSPFMGLIFFSGTKKIYETSAFCKRWGNIIPFQQRGFMCFPYLLHYGKTNFHSLCENCSHLCSCFTAPIAAIIDISHSLRKYIVVKKCTYIHIYFWIFCRLRERKITHWLASVGADAFTWCCCTAQNKTDLF